MDYYSKLLEIMPEEKLEKEIVKKIGEFHGYLSRDAAAMLLAKENRLYKPEAEYSKIKDIKERQRKINIKGKITEIGKTNYYPSGKKSREIILKDETGKIPFTLWEEKLELFSKIRLNDEIEINKAYERNGKLNLMYGGEIKILSKKGFNSFDSLNEKDSFNVMGTVIKIEGTESFYLSDGKTEKKAFILQEKSRFSSLEQGDELLLENVRFRNNRIEISSDSRVFIRKPRDIISGEVESMELKGEKLEVKIEGKTSIFEGNDIYKFLNTKKPANLSLETLIKLKREFYIGKRIFIKFKSNTLDRVSIL